MTARIVRRTAVGPSWVTPRVAAVLVAAGSVLGIGCGDSDSTSRTTTVIRTTIEPVTPDAPVGLRVAKYATSFTQIVSAHSIVVRGRVTPGAVVRVAGRKAHVSGRRWSVRVPLELGPNPMIVTAEKPGLATTTVRIAVVRV